MTEALPKISDTDTRFAAFGRREWRMFVLSIDSAITTINSDIASIGVDAIDELQSSLHNLESFDPQELYLAAETLITNFNSQLPETINYSVIIDEQGQLDIRYKS